jgi:transcriptional regulator with GAF, ATPase, and Fis domain
MPTLTWRTKSGKRESCAVSKSITVIGSDSSCDVCIQENEFQSRQAQLIFNGKTFCISSIDNNDCISVSGKPKRKVKLGHEERIKIKDVEFTFSLLSMPISDPKETTDNDAQALDILRQLLAFSQKLLAHDNLSDILKELMDAVVELTGASKGFLVLFENGAPSVKVARNIRQENIQNAVAQLSDSIVARVVDTKKPLIVSDAMNDTSFSNAESVINLKLSSVMCVPLLDRGRLLGLIYVGNDHVSGLFRTESLDLLVLFAAQASILVQNALLVDELKLKNMSLSEELNRQRYGEIVGSSPSMLEVYRKVSKVATADVSVLISGETGTGKELIANEIHRRSARAQGSFVTVNCGAIPENLMESEFFGHMRGAFTGAVATREGKFQAAHKGTLFLDEIGEMPASLQVKLLRVLQEHQVVRVGAVKPETVDIRVIAATNRDLEKEVAEGRFREDLYYRLNVVHVDLPALRDRGEDILLLARYLLQTFIKKYAGKVKGFTPGAVAAMKKHLWQGNVRELENRIKKAVILCDGTMIGPKDLDLNPDALPAILSLADAKEQFQREYVLQVLERNNGNRTQTARDLDVDPRTVFRYLEKA